MEETNFSNQSPQQNQSTQQPFSNQYGQLLAPNSVAVLVLGILSLVLCICYGVVGLVLGIIALVLAKKGNAIYQLNPNAYSLSSYNNLKAGKICAIIGVILSSLYIIGIIIYIVLLGTALGIIPWSDSFGHHQY